MREWTATIVTAMLSIIGRYGAIIAAFIAGNNWAVLQSSDGDVGPWDYAWRVGLVVFVLLFGATIAAIGDALGVLHVWMSRASLSTKKGGDLNLSADVETLALLASSKVRQLDSQGLKRIEEMVLHEKGRTA